MCKRNRRGAGHANGFDRRIELQSSDHPLALQMMSVERRSNETLMVVNHKGEAAVPLLPEI
jgi:hypothetical protein